MMIVPPSAEEQLIIVTVIGAQENRARIGVKAPDAVAVHREEVYARIAKGEKERHVKPCDTQREDDQNGS